MRPDVDWERRHDHPLAGNGGAYLERAANGLLTTWPAGRFGIPEAGGKTETFLTILLGVCVSSEHEVQLYET